MGKHLWDISIVTVASLNLSIVRLMSRPNSRPSKQAADATQPNYLIVILTPWTMMFIKVSFFILYLQLFKQMERLRVCIWIGLVFTACVYTGLGITMFYFHTPRPHETWLAHEESKYGQITTRLSVPQSVVGLVIDIYILVIPIIGITSTKMSTKRKLGVILVFLSGVM
jgi:hypothetical protein